MNIKMTIYEGNNTLNVADYTPTVTLTVVDNLYQSGGGGAVNSVNGKTGTVVLGANDINESSTRFWLTDVLKTAYDGAVSAIANMYTKSEVNTLLDNKVDKVSGKGLSQNDFTNDLKASYDGAVSGLSNKVDKVTGKGLSENDYITADKNKLDGIQSGAEVNVNADWNATSGDAEILNKPTIPDTSTFALKSEVATVIFKSITQTIITGKTAETSIYAIPLPMDGSNYMIRVYSQAQISTYAGSGNINHRLRVGTYSSVIDGSVGANSIGQQTVIAINGLSSSHQFPITRNFKFVGGASGYIYGFSASTFAGDDANSTTPFSLLTSKDFTTQHYLYVSFNPSNVGAIVTHNQILVTLIKI